VLGPRGVPLHLGGVVPVVAGQVELAEVEEGVPAVQLETGVDDPRLLLGRGQVRLVVRVRLPLAFGPRRREPGQPGPDSCRGQILRRAVVLVPACELAYLGDGQVADGAYPGGEVHGRDVTARSGCSSLNPLAGPARRSAAASRTGTFPDAGFSWAAAPMRGSGHG
jgi:hypothetical protein